MPWRGVDPIVASAQVVLGLQTIVSRQIDIAHEPAVLTVGAIQGGVRENIIPDSVEMRGTIRTFDESMRDDIHERVRDTAEMISRASRATCEVCISKNYEVTVNDPELTESTVPTLERVAGAARVVVVAKIMRLRGLLVLPAGRARASSTSSASRRRGRIRRPRPRTTRRCSSSTSRRLGVALRSLAQVAVDWLEAQAPLRAAA